MWSVGAAVVEKDRPSLDQFIKEICGWNTIDNGPNMDRHVGVASLPERGTLFDYLFDVESRRWSSWRWQLFHLGMARVSAGTCTKAGDDQCHHRRQPSLFWEHRSES